MSILTFQYLSVADHCREADGHTRLKDDTWEGCPGGAFRGFVFSMLFNLLLLACAATLWAVLRL